jgi:hypothetical protein
VGALTPARRRREPGDDLGQALVITAMLIAIAAVAIVGLDSVQRRIAASVQHDRAGEAAVEAAASALADAYVLRSRAGTFGRAEVDALLRDDAAVRAARASADDLSRRNGGGLVTGVTASCREGRVEVSVVLEGSTHRAAFSAPECSRR